jgi:hypothetical protein
MSCTDNTWTSVSQTQYWDQKSGGWSAETITWDGASTIWSVGRDISWAEINSGWGINNASWGDASGDDSSWSQQSDTLIWPIATTGWGSTTGTWKSKSTHWDINTPVDLCWDKAPTTWDNTGAVY